MKNEAVEADALYVLGDLFEFWIGDDDTSDFAKSIRQAFIDLVAQGVPCYFTQVIAISWLASDSPSKRV